MMWKLGFIILLTQGAGTILATSLPSSFDLRSVDGKKYVSSVKKQSGGTCWTFGSMSAIEGNLLRTGVWTDSGETGEANLAEYHLDWWNGFNQHFNADISPSSGGLTVHQGGDYRVAAAYFGRGEGAVRDKDGQSFSSAPKQNSPDYRHYYVREIEWLSAGKNLENIETLKTALMENGVLGTAITWSGSYYSSSRNTFYQPSSSNSDPNHAVSIVGWDDNKQTQASKPGAWLAKNSWGSSWGDGGFFWISYYDKISGQHDEMGAVSFNHTEPMRYDHIYFHDYHGWRDTKKDVKEAFNAFTAKADQNIESVSLYTAEPDVEYSVHIFKTFENNQLSVMLGVVDGKAAHTGLHTVDLNWPVPVRAGEKFYVHVELSHGGHAFDKTSNVPLLLGGGGRPIVKSKANPGESFYKRNGQWVDLTNDDNTANFCIKALAVDR